MRWICVAELCIDWMRWTWAMRQMWRSDSMRWMWSSDSYPAVSCRLLHSLAVSCSVLPSHALSSRLMQCVQYFAYVNAIIEWHIHQWDAYVTHVSCLCDTHVTHQWAAYVTHVIMRWWHKSDFEERYPTQRPKWDTCVTLYEYVMVQHTAWHTYEWAHRCPTRNESCMCHT